MIRNRMNPIGPSKIPAPQPNAPSGSARESLQVGLLKKSLEVQRQLAEQLLRQTEGKGQVIDLRA